jgi:hypothetical protein
MFEAECPICHLQFHASAGAACPGCGHIHLIIKGEVEDEKKEDPVAEEAKSDEVPAANVSIGAA